MKKNVIIGLLVFVSASLALRPWDWSGAVSAGVVQSQPKAREPEPRWKVEARERLVSHGLPEDYPQLSDDNLHEKMRQPRYVLMVSNRLWNRGWASEWHTNSAGEFVGTHSATRTGLSYTIGF